MNFVNIFANSSNHRPRPHSHPSVLFNASIRSGSNVPFLNDFLWSACHDPALFSSAFLEDELGLLPKFANCSTQSELFSWKVRTPPCSHSHPSVSFNASIRSGSNVPFLNNALCFICHNPALFSAAFLEVQLGLLPRITNCSSSIAPSGCLLYNIGVL